MLEAPSIILPIAIRPMRPSDESLVYSSWLGSLADELKLPPDSRERRTFWNSQKGTVAALLKRSVKAVATARGDDDQIFGWICVELPDVLHFVFVKKDWRRGGIAWQLVEATGIAKTARASHYTSWGFPRIQRLFDTLTLDPTLGAI